MWHSEDAYTPEELARQAKVEVRREAREQNTPKPPTQFTTSMGRRQYKKGVAKAHPPPAITVYNPYSLLAESPKVLKSTVNPASYISLGTYEKQQEREATYRQDRGWQVQKRKSKPSPVDPQAPVPGKEGVVLLSQPP